MTFGRANLSYSDSKLLMILLARAVARQWRDVNVNTVDPGSVPPKMGGRDAPDDLAQGSETQAWLAVSDDAAARVTGQHLHHKRHASHHPAVEAMTLQDEFLAICAQITGIVLPTHSAETGIDDDFVGAR